MSSEQVTNDYHGYRNQRQMNAQRSNPSIMSRNILTQQGSMEEAKTFIQKRKGAHSSQAASTMATFVGGGDQVTAGQTNGSRPSRMSKYHSVPLTGKITGRREPPMHHQIQMSKSTSKIPTMDSPWAQNEAPVAPVSVTQQMQQGEPITRSVSDNASPSAHQEMINDIKEQASNTTISPRPRKSDYSKVRFSGVDPLISPARSQNSGSSRPHWR